MANDALDRGVKVQRSDFTDFAEAKANTDGASTVFTSKFIAATGKRNIITDISIANTSATTVTVDIRDGAAGSVLFTFIAPAGGGVVHRFATPLRQSLNTALAFDPSAAATTITCSASGYQSDI